MVTLFPIQKLESGMSVLETYIGVFYIVFSKAVHSFVKVQSIFPSGNNSKYSCNILYFKLFSASSDI